MAATIPVTVLLTRPKAASERFAALIDGPSVISPLMRTAWLSPDHMPGADAVVFTSETGVQGWTRLHDRRGVAYCVGDRTAAAARAAGFEAQNAKGNARDLAAMLAELPATMRLLHVRGVHVAADLGARVTPYVVYEQQPCALSREAAALLGAEGKVVLPFFSPRSVALFEAQNSPLHATLIPVAMSKAVADAVHSAGLGTALVAETPDADAMLRVIRSVLP